MFSPVAPEGSQTDVAVGSHAHTEAPRTASTSSADAGVLAIGDTGQESSAVRNASDISGAASRERTLEPTSPAAVGTRRKSISSVCMQMASPAEIREKLAKVEQLTERLLNYEAACVLRVIDAQMEFVASDTDDKELENILQRLKSDNMLASLREFLERYEKALEDIAVPAQRDDIEWGEFEIRDPTISEDFLISFKVRYKTSDEYDPEGPMAQFVSRAEIRNMPLRPSRRIALEREVDLIQAVTPPSVKMELCDGKANPRDNLFSARLRMINKQQYNPWKMDTYELREFSAFENPPIEGMREHMYLMMCSTPPQNASWFGGVQVPPCTKGCKRIYGVTILRFVEPEATPDRCRITVMAQGAVNIPTWLLPVALVKRILGNFLASSMKNIAENVSVNWAELGYQERIDQCQEFYGPVASYDTCDAAHS